MGKVPWLKNKIDVAIRTMAERKTTPALALWFLSARQIKPAAKGKRIAIPIKLPVKTCYLPSQFFK